MTILNPHGDCCTVNGERVLAIWLGGGTFYCTLYDTNSGNADYVKTFKYPNLDGIWYFISFTYSGSKSAANWYVYNAIDNSVN